MSFETQAGQIQVHTSVALKLFGKYNINHLASKLCNYMSIYLITSACTNKIIHWYSDSKTKP